MLEPAQQPETRMPGRPLNTTAESQVRGSSPCPANRRDFITFSVLLSTARRQFRCRGGSTGMCPNTENVMMDEPKKSDAQHETTKARSGVMDGVRLGIGMFIVLPLIVVFVVIALILLAAAT